MMESEQLVEWEKKLKTVLDKADEMLEDEFGKDVPLHPARAGRGTTANKASDGLFAVTGKFSLGIGSKHGPGYGVEVRMVTLSHVAPELREEAEEKAGKLLARDIPLAFPDRQIEVSREGNVFRIHGDLRLGKAYEL